MFKTRVYIASTKELEEKSEFSRFYKLVPDYRKVKVDSYSSLKDKCLSLGAGIIFSKALSDAGLIEKDFIYSYRESGMPYFKNHPEVFFSIAHSNYRVMCAISENPIGVDCELIKDSKTQETLDWVKTESYAKATDTSLSSILAGKLVFNPEFIFKEIIKDDGYKYMICSREKIEDSQIFQIQNICEI